MMFKYFQHWLDRMNLEFESILEEKKVRYTKMEKENYIFN